ncbi:hypothetical protein TKK_0001049 [Trichogramma kaykai]
MKCLENYSLCEKSEEFWYDHKEFVNKSKTIKILPRIRLYSMADSDESEREKRAITMIPSLLLHDLVGIPTEEAVKLPAHYYEAARSCGIHDVSEKLRQACTMHLCEMTSRRFFRRWALDCFWELADYRLPNLCCEIIIKKLKNKDLFNICLAATG